MPRPRLHRRSLTYLDLRVNQQGGVQMPVPPVSQYHWDSRAMMHREVIKVPTRAMNQMVQYTIM